MIFSFKPNENTRIHIRDKTGVEHKQNLSHSYQLKKKKSQQQQQQQQQKTKKLARTEWIMWDEKFLSS